MNAVRHHHLASQAGRQRAFSGRRGRDETTEMHERLAGGSSSGPAPAPQRRGSGSTGLTSPMSHWQTGRLAALQN
jgi:hypothetical protein